MNISASIRKITIFFVVVFVAMSGGLIYWQVVVADQLTVNIHNNRRCLTQNTPRRGRILDRNGVVLAESIPDNNVCGGYIRHYTDPGLAGLIGYYVPGYPSYPTSSIEAQYGSYLSGQVGSTVLSKEVNNVLHTSPVGDDIYLTIDERIQKIAEQDYQNYNQPTSVQYGNDVYDSNRGAAVISNPQTGEVLAMVSAPGFDPNKMVQTLSKNHLSYYDQLNNDPGTPLFYRPLQGRYSPGSTFKTVTLLAGLDTGATTLNQQWNKQLSYDDWHVDGITITGNNLGYPLYLHRFPVNTEFGFANSDNIMFARIGRSIGEDKWLEYTKRMYIDQNIPSELKIAESSVMQPNGNLSDAEFLNDVYGQGVDNITPFQMSLVDNVAANNGVLMRPLFFTKITDHDGNPIETYSPQELSTVVSKDTAYQVREAMNAVTTCGSAWRVNTANQPPTTVIGKTGTAQLGGDLHPHGWMITQAPFFFGQEDQMPALTIVAMRENGGEGAYSAGPAIWHMYTDIFNQKLVKTQLSDWINPENFCATQHLWH